MPRPLGHLRIMMSTRVLLDLEKAVKADQIFREEGAEGLYRLPALSGGIQGRGRSGARRHAPPGKGPMFDVAVALSRLNKPGARSRLSRSACPARTTSNPRGRFFTNLSHTVLGPALEWEAATAGRPIERIHSPGLQNRFVPDTQQE